MQSIEICTTNEGDLTFICKDGMEALLKEGEATVQRASHVEPYPTADGIFWYADMRPVGGPRLDGFTTRAAALSAEVKHLTQLLNTQ